MISHLANKKILKLSNSLVFILYGFMVKSSNK